MESERFRGQDKWQRLWGCGVWEKRRPVEFEDLGGGGVREVGKWRSWGEEFGVWGTIGIWEFRVVHIGR